MNELQDVTQLIADVDKKFGKGTLTFSPSSFPLDFIPTGSLALDLAIGGGERLMGIPHGRMTEIWGEKSTGKSTLCYHIIANAQAQGKTTALFDYEHSYDPVYAEAIGVDTQKLLLGQYQQLEQGWQIIEAMMRSLKNTVIVIDSIAQMSPRAELEGEMGDHHPGLQPRLLAQAMRRNKGWVRMNNSALVIVNQIRHKMGVKNPKYERTETQPGGEGLKHAIDLQINLYLSKKAEDDLSRKIRSYIEFSKIAKPYGKASYNIVFGQGVEVYDDLREVGEACGAIEKKGAYYYLNGELIAHGQSKFVKWLKEDQEHFNLIRENIINTLSGGEKDA